MKNLPVCYELQWLDTSNNEWRSIYFTNGYKKTDDFDFAKEQFEAKRSKYPDQNFRLVKLIPDII